MLGILFLERLDGDQFKRLKRDAWIYVIILSGLLTRLLSVVFMDIQHDGAAYTAMGHQLALHGNLIMPFGDGNNFSTFPAPASQYPPLYPGYLAIFYHFGGYGILETKIANLALAFAAVAVVWACTKSLFGLKPALLTAALFAVIPRFSMAAGTGFSENLGAITFTVTLWSLLRGIKHPKYFIATGIAAGACYLIRGSMGPFFFVGLAIGGLIVGRLVGFKSFRNWWAAIGGALFLVIAGAWAIRNLIAFGTTDAGGYGAALWRLILHRPAMLAAGFLFKFGQYGAILLLFYAVFKPEWRASWSNSTPAMRLLWLCVLGIAGLGMFISAINYAQEQSPPLWMDSERYLSVAYVPLLWLFFHGYGKSETPIQPHTFRARYLILAAVFVAASAYEIAEPTTIPEAHAAAKLDPYLHAGDTIGIYNATLARYTFYPYLPTLEVREQLCMGPSTNPCNGMAPAVLFATQILPVAGYRLVAQEQNHFILGGNSQTIYVYAKVNA